MFRRCENRCTLPRGLRHVGAVLGRGPASLPPHGPRHVGAVLGRGACILTSPRVSARGREASERRLLHFYTRHFFVMAATKPRTSVYIDAFNLYFGALKGTPFRWLDLEALCRVYLPRNDIVSIKYFTANVSARESDPQQPIRQQAYLRAISTLPTVSVVYGHYLSHVVSARLANPPTSGSPYVKIIKTEEKGSDVNLATHLLHDAHLNRFDIAVVVSNDSDLLEPIRLVRQELKKTVGVLNPHKNPSRAIQPHVDFYKPIRQGALQQCQLPEMLTDSRGTIRKPASW